MANPQTESSLLRFPGDPAPVPSRPDKEIHGFAVTDASGHYRLEGLDVGRYRVVAGLLNWLTYYPGVQDGGKSTTIEITDASLKSGVDFTLQSPVGVRVSGRVTRSNPRATLPAVCHVEQQLGQRSIRATADQDRGRWFVRVFQSAPGNLSGKDQS